MNAYVALNGVLELVALGFSIQEVNARIAEELAKGTSEMNITAKLKQWRKDAIAEAQAEIDQMPE